MSLQKLYLELTDRCNLDCTICYRQSWKNPAGDMDLHLFYSLLEEIQHQPEIQMIVFGGIGEPTCSPVFSAAVHALHDRKLILTTNGVFDADLVPLLAAHMDTIVISMDGLPENYERIRGTTSAPMLTNFQALVAMKHENRRGPQMLLQCVLSSDNMSDALPLVDFAADIGADGLVFSHLLPQVPDNRDKIVYSLHANNQLKQLFGELRIRSLRRGLQLTLPPVTLKTERFCSFIEDESAFVCASGDVVPCYRLSHDYTEYVFGRKKAVHLHAFGNVQQQSLMDIWNSKAYMLYRERVRNGRYPSCLDCDLVDGCDYVRSSDADCWCNTPSCADCLWSRRLVICP